MWVGGCMWGRGYRCEYGCACDAQIFQSKHKLRGSTFLRPTLCVCVCDAQSLKQIQSARSDTPPLCIIVRTTSMFGLSSIGAFPPSQHDNKTMYRECIPTVSRIPCVNAPLPGQGPPWASLPLGARRWNDRRGALASHAVLVVFASVPAAGLCKRKTPAAVCPPP